MIVPFVYFQMFDLLFLLDSVGVFSLVWHREHCIAQNLSGVYSIHLTYYFEFGYVKGTHNQSQSLQTQILKTLFSIQMYYESYSWYS